MATLCRCERCSSIVPRSTGSVVAKLVYASAWLSLIPVGSLLFVAGPGVVGIFPMVMFHGFAIDMSLRDWAFPRPLCKECGATLEDAPVVRGGAPVLSPVRA
jgi:hypothetical protein